MWRELVLFAFVATTTVAGDEPQSVDELKAPDDTVATEVTVTADTSTNEETSDGYAPVCGLNEVYSSCINGGCGYKNCSQIGQPKLCVDPAPGNRIKGCVCASGYLRAANGTCVPQDQCPKTGCNGDPNAHPGCGVNCGRNCATYKIKGVKCGAICNPNGCDCNEDYVYDNLAKRCVRPEDCTKPCGNNEYWEPCIGGCSNQSCSEVGYPPRSCPAQIVGQCKSGCRCKKGYCRDSNNVCVQIPKCTGENEYWNDCIKGCSNQTCDTIGKIFHCPLQKGCATGCRCNPGFYRDKNNICIPENQCPTPECPDGEVWSKCPTVKCEGDYCQKTKDSPQTCPVGIVCDKPRCVCGLNKKRDWKTRKCISITDCPKFKCGINEKYQACPGPCSGDNCTDYFIKPKCPIGKIGITLICRPQCKCIKGYYRNTDGVCVPARDCARPITSIETTTPPPTPVVITSSDRGTGLTGLLDGITAFTRKCLYNRMKSAPSENIAMSAMSVMIPIGILCLYSEEEAYDQCMKILNLKDKQDIRNTFPLLGSFYDVQTSANFSTAAKIYSNEKYQLSDAIKKDAVSFKAGAQELNFGNAELAAQIINAWVENQTNNRIKDLVSKDMFNALTRIVLVNAIYFKDDWMYQFDEENTKDEDFYLSDGTTTKTKLMSQLGNFKYADVPQFNCTALKMNYKGGNFSMVIVLPNAVDGTLPLAEKLQDPDNWKKVYGSLANEKVQVYIPSFEINTSTDLKDLLQKVNITKWFDPDDSGIKGILKNPEDIYISNAIQKAFIKCDEKGSEAAAANAFVGATTTAVGPPPRPPKLFRADRGFLFYILLNGSAIFSGHCGKP